MGERETGWEWEKGLKLKEIKGAKNDKSIKKTNPSEGMHGKLFILTERWIYCMLLHMRALIWLHVLHWYMRVLPSPSHFSSTRMSMLHMYVSSNHSVSRVGIGVYDSLLVTEHLRPEVRNKGSHWFWEEVRDVLSKIGWMEIIFLWCSQLLGRIIGLMVNIHSPCSLTFLTALPFALPCLSYFHILSLYFCSPSPVSLRPSPFAAAPPMCTLTPNPCSGAAEAQTLAF